MNSLLEKAMDAHGGLENWEKIRLLHIDLDIGGNILMTKFNSPLNRQYACTIDPNNVKVILDPFPKPGFQGVYRGKDVQIQGEGGNETGRKRIDKSDLTRRFVWDDLDVLYFLGYAIWNYALAPFLFHKPGFDLEELEPQEQKSGETVRRLKVVFPETIPTHCSEQTFYFNEQGLLIRLDYTAEIFGKWAKGAHICSQHKTFDNFVFPTKRKVYGTLLTNNPTPSITAMQGEIRNVQVLYQGAGIE